MNHLAQRPTTRRQYCCVLDASTLIGLMSRVCMLALATKSYLSGLLLRLVVASSLVCFRLEATQVDCSTSSPPAECCQMEPAQPCLIRDMVSPLHHCSIACKKRFATLSWDCYEDYNMLHQWRTMQSNCDPQSSVRFTAPSSTPRPSSGANNRAGAADEDSKSADNKSSVIVLLVCIMAGGMVAAGMFLVCWTYIKNRREGETRVVDASVVKVGVRRPAADVEAQRPQPEPLRMASWHTAAEMASWHTTAATKGRVSQEKQEHGRVRQMPSREGLVSLPTPARAVGLRVN